MWRWFLITSADQLVDGVFSTYVEVILVVSIWFQVFVKYSPRMWRWSLRRWLTNEFKPVFSTYVEVILRWKLSCPLPWSILHVCGGDPELGLSSLNNMKYSPRMWRWSPSRSGNKWKQSVFSTYVEVIPALRSINLASLRILHVCGGDPINNRPSRNINAYSPRMWRWSYATANDLKELKVFSTYVEVIPFIAEISLKTWSVFSTYVEVIPWSWTPALIELGILHVCGGDPK